MNSATKFFVRAKHWQVFAVLLGAMCVADVIAQWWSLPGQGPWSATFVPLFLSSTLLGVSYALWTWSLGIFLNSAVRPDLRLGTKLLRIAAVFPAVYLPLFDVFLSNVRPVLFLLNLPLQAFATFCLFYSLYFISKSLVLAEKETTIEFPNYIGTLFLIWCFPIGVWFTQPRINRLYAASLNEKIA